MPHIKIRGLDQKTVNQFSKELIERVAEIMGYPKTHITLEQPLSHFFVSAGNPAPSPVIEVFWLDLGNPIKQRTVNTITSIIRRKTGISGNITIIFFDKSDQAFFMNGQCFDPSTDRRESADR
ncbi:DUF1904 family protein [Kistimonas asteriae]|uniref:DUF1904 family protein n=1 Tax=Kistimonas asteriae TaxID=517724 RepID=UPI001BAC3882|nr:DUF1904 family protein [Kistimonas asteriae]